MTLDYTDAVVRDATAYQLRRGQSHAHAVVEATGTAWLPRTVWNR